MREHSSKQPHAFLSHEDFQTMASVLDGYILYLKRLEKESTGFQELYTRVDIAAAQAAGRNAETLYLSHEDLMMVLRAIFEVEEALYAHKVEALEPYRDVMKEKVGVLRARMLAAFPSANREDRARLN